MGIPRLTRHLLPFSEAVLLKGGQDVQNRETGWIDSIVIDGPSLVYNVFSRLLSWSSVDFPAGQPTCNEVSCGVMMYLLQLTILGVKIENIVFDGALPLQKRDTRLSRLEKSRRRLELFRHRTQHGFKTSSDSSTARIVNPEKVLRSRPCSARYNDSPDNPFMVAAVFEDLRCRWTRDNILNAAQDFLTAHLIDLEDFPWSDITVMVPGEADMHCAYVARLTGSAVLTNDSDLILYDLGSHGSVVMLNSIELTGWNPLNPLESQIQAVRLYPKLIARRLGISDVLLFGYELKNHPDLGLTELVRLSKTTSDTSADYDIFFQEYRGVSTYEVRGEESQPLLPNVDARVSEIFWQYESQNTNTFPEAPQMYLAILNEDPARQCAWKNGRLYRTLGYSVFNASCPVSKRSTFIDEFVRRGERISKDRISLGKEEWITTEMRILHTRLNLVRTDFNKDFTLPGYWQLFALHDMYTRETTGSPLPDAGQLRRFLSLGYMGQKLEWADIHLNAQIHAVLYSLRILKQLLGLAKFTSDLAVEMESMKSILAGLPPLHIMMRPRFEMTQELPSEDSVDDFVDKLFQLGQGSACVGATQGVDDAEDKSLSNRMYLSSQEHRKFFAGDMTPSHKRVKSSHKKRSNMYELLSKE